MCCETFRPRAHCGRLACCLALALALLGAANRMPVTHEQAKAGAGKVVVGRRHENETFKIMMRQHTMSFMEADLNGDGCSSSWSSLWSSTARSSESRLLHLCTSCLHLPWSQGSKFYGCTECSHLIVQSMAEYMIVPVACRTNESETADRSTDEPYAGVYSHFLLSSAALLSTTFL